MFHSEFQCLLSGERALLGQERLFRQGLWCSESISVGTLADHGYQMGLLYALK